MNFDEYQDGCMRTFSAKNDLLRERIIATALGLSGETGEYVDKIKKLLFHGHNIKGEDILLELGDILYYLAVAAHVWGYSFETVAKMNQEKLQKRYPDGFSSQRSRERERHG